MKELLQEEQTRQPHSALECEVCGLATAESTKLCRLCVLCQPVLPLSFSPAASIYNAAVGKQYARA